MCVRYSHHLPSSPFLSFIGIMWKVIYRLIDWFIYSLTEWLLAWLLDWLFDSTTSNFPHYISANIVRIVQSGKQHVPFIFLLTSYSASNVQIFVCWLVVLYDAQPIHNIVHSKMSFFPLSKLILLQLYTQTLFCTTQIKNPPIDLGSYFFSRNRTTLCTYVLS